MKFKNLGGPQVRSINLIDYYTKRQILCNKSQFIYVKEKSPKQIFRNNVVYYF